MYQFRLFYILFFIHKCEGKRHLDRPGLVSPVSRSILYEDTRLSLCVCVWRARMCARADVQPFHAGHITVCMENLRKYTRTIYSRIRIRALVFVCNTYETK